MELTPREYWKSHRRWYNVMEVACITQRRHRGGHGMLTYRGVRQLQLISIWINRSLILSFPSNRIESVSKALRTKEKKPSDEEEEGCLPYFYFVGIIFNDVISVHEIKKGTFELHRNMRAPFQEVHHNRFSAQRTATRRRSQRGGTDRWVPSRGSCLAAKGSHFQFGWKTIRCYVGR